MKRTLRIALVLLAIIAILSAQTWFNIDLAAGGKLAISGIEAFPLFGSALLADALAIALVLYLGRRWGVVFIMASAIVLVITLVISIPAVFGADLSVLSPIVEKATGIASWISQLETVIFKREANAMGAASWLLTLALVGVHAMAILDAVRAQKQRIEAAPKKATEDNNSLWNETNP